jgi:hypothetical protein
MIATLQPFLIDTGSHFVGVAAEEVTPLGQAIGDRCAGELHHRFGRNVGACDNERQEAAWWARWCVVAFGEDATGTYAPVAVDADELMPY